uniref:Uncharacterized protein n=1 Tax=Panagrolaimus davidi TaxID=227884 RepID=A0A914PVQ0_9BILA
MEKEPRKLIFSTCTFPSTTIIPCKNHNFSVPNPIINYITDNIESPLIHEKLISSSKYFFFVNPYIRGSIYYSYFEDRSFTEKGHQCKEGCYFRQKFENIDSSIKFWIIDSIYIMNQIAASSLSLLIPKIYRCDITNLVLTAVNLTFEEFLFISPTVKDVHFSNVKVTYKNDEIVLLEDIFDNFPKLTACSFSISHTAPNISMNTAKRILESPNFSNITDICIEKTPEIFDIKTFVNSVKDRELPRFWINIDRITSENYESELEECINQLINSKYNNRMIQYSEEDAENFMILLNRYDDQYVRILTMG